MTTELTSSCYFPSLTLLCFLFLLLRFTITLRAVLVMHSPESTVYSKEITVFGEGRDDGKRLSSNMNSDKGKEDEGGKRLGEIGTNGFLLLGVGGLCFTAYATVKAGVLSFMVTTRIVKCAGRILYSGMMQH